MTLPRDALVGMLAAAVLAGAAACAATERAPIRIGVVVGGDGADGAQMAAAEVNASGGIDGRPVALVVVPFAVATAAQPSIAAADSLANDPAVVAVVGHSNSAASLAASQVYNARQLVHIAPTTTAPLFSDAGPYSFRLVPDDRKQAEFLARQVTGGPPRRVALMYVNDDYGRALATSVRERLVDAGIRPVYETPYLQGADSAQLGGSAAAVVRARPELLLWLGRAPELAAVLAVVRPRLPRLIVYASDGVDVNAIYARPQRFPGVRFVRFVDPDAPSAALQRFRARFRAAEGRDVTTDAVTAYDAVMLLATALRAGARSRTDVRAYLETVGRGRPAYAGVSGPIAFDERGDVARPHLLAEAQPGGVRTLPAR